MQKKYLPSLLLLAVLLTLLAFCGLRAQATVPAIGFADEKKVYLTFDDGPSTKVTARVLDTLKEEGVKATFFIVSDRVAGREEILKRTAAEGHTLGVHSASHRYDAIYASDEALLGDVDRCAEVIERVTGVTPHVYRFPGGGKGKTARERQTKLLEARGYRVVLWNAVCGDEEIPCASAEMLVAETEKTSAGKETVVLLLHDSAHHAATAEALPRIIAYYRSLGYTFCQF